MLEAVCGNQDIRPESITRIWSSHWRAIMFIPNSPIPPNGMASTKAEESKLILSFPDQVAMPA